MSNTQEIPVVLDNGAVMPSKAHKDDPDRKIYQRKPG